MVIIGAGANHWYHNNLLYRSAIVALMLTGSVGVNGGGLAHYVGQEKLANQASWGAIAFAADWKLPNRQQNTPSFHYVHTDQWRYERGFTAYDVLPGEKQKEHTIDYQVRRCARAGCPSSRSSTAVAGCRQGCRGRGRQSEAEVIQYTVDQLRSGGLRFAVEDPDAAENWPRIWFIWRGNAIGTSMKGHEYMMKHYLGTHSNINAREMAQGYTNEVEYRAEAPRASLTWWWI